MNFLSIRYLFDNGVFDELINELDIKDTTFQKVVLEGICNLIKGGDEKIDKNLLKTKIVNCGGIEKLEEQLKSGKSIFFL